MTEPRRALHAHLAADTGVTSKINDRIYQGRGPAGEEKPLILIQPPISRIPRRILDGVAYRSTRLQVTVMADTQKDAEDTAAAVISAIDGITGSMGSEGLSMDVVLVEVDNDRQVAYEEIDEIHHHVDVMITY